MLRDTFCSYCGRAFGGDLAIYPRQCDGCRYWVYHNPTAVCVAMVPVNDDGLLMIRRNNMPGRGMLALPGGYLEFGETWTRCLARELFEETCLSIDTDDAVLIAGRTSDLSGALLLFGLCRPIQLDLPYHFTLDASAKIETQEVVVVHAPVETCFSHHTDMVAWFFDHKRARKS